MRPLRFYRSGIAALALIAGLFGLPIRSWSGNLGVHQIVVPEEDRFTPFALTIHFGEAVEWINMDTDDHTVVSDDTFTTAGHLGTNHLLPGTDTTGGPFSRFTLRFFKPGVFVYYCRFHAHLDVDNQPIAPGPDGGIQDNTGNFGTPMNGVITVLPW